LRICRQVSPADAIYVSDEWEAAEDIRQALLADNRAVVRVPDRVRTGFENVPAAVSHATPEFMRRYFEKNAKLQAAIRSDRARVVRLLQYCLSDMILGCPADTDGGEQYKRLCGLPILPTADGGYQKIAPPVKTVQGSLLVGTPEEIQLLERLSAELVDPGLPSGVLEHLRSEAMVTYTNVRVLTPELLAGCLHRVLPAGWEGIPEVQWRVGDDGQPDAAWMRRFWEYASEDCLAAFRRWPLVPTCEGTLCAVGVGDGDSKVFDDQGSFRIYTIYICVHVHTHTRTHTHTHTYTYIHTYIHTFRC
jgi:hypothetical protein